MTTVDFTTMTNEELAQHLSDTQAKAAALFALETPTIAEVDEAETLVASIRDVEAEMKTRQDAVDDAAKRFAAAKASFASDEEEEEIEEGVAAESDDEEFVEGAKDEEEIVEEEEELEELSGETQEADNSEGGETATMTASARNSQRIPAKAASVAKKVGQRTQRRDVKETPEIIITAGADVPGFTTGQQISTMTDVTKAVMNRVKGFAPFNLNAAKANHNASSGEPVLSKFGVASFGVPIDKSISAEAGFDYSAVRNSIKQYTTSPDLLTAGGWCAPSETVYSYISDYVVDGLITVPEVGAPRGGLMLTTGPAVSTQGAALDSFGFTQTEAQAINRDSKSCETITCPDFTDHRLDAIGYCFKIPFLTQKAYPELIEDALKLANVRYAHKVNARIISDIVGMATPASAAPYGATFTDTLEALSVIAVRERRKWNIGDSTVMEVKLPTFTKEVFRSDISRRNNVSVDAVTDQQINAHFAVRNLAVEYVNDWQELTSPDAAWPGNFDALIYPSGTFIKAVEDVVNLSAVYDAASLSINEYTGVFFEQGILVAKQAYGATKITIDVCTAGLTGAASLGCTGSL